MSKVYTYDVYTTPNPGGANEGNGWYINYDTNHPYIKHIVVLSPATTPSGGALTQKVVGSYKVHQDKKEANATDLHYDVSTDVDILSYSTKIDWGTKNTPAIKESSPQRRQISVDWNLADNPVPYCNWVTITTEFILPYWNAMQYSNVHFTYPQGVDGKVAPSVKWDYANAHDREGNVDSRCYGWLCGGSFDIVNPNVETKQRGCWGIPVDP